MGKPEFVEVAPRGIASMNWKIGAMLLDKTRGNGISAESKKEIDSLLTRAGEVAHAFSGLMFSLDECAAIGILTASLEAQEIRYKTGSTRVLRNVIKSDSFRSLVEKIAVLEGVK